MIAAEQDLILRAGAAYFEALAAYDNLGFAEAEKKSLSRQLDQAQQRFDVGLTAITDVQEAQAGYDRAFAAEIEARNNVDNTQEALREITGAYFSDLAPLGETMPLLAPEPEQIEAWTGAALEQNLDVLAAQHAVNNARRESNASRQATCPHSTWLPATAWMKPVAVSAQLKARPLRWGCNCASLYSKEAMSARVSGRPMNA